MKQNKLPWSGTTYASHYGTLTNYFAFLTLFIAGLGWFALSVYTAESRIKEIGIRKVLAPSAPQLWQHYEYHTEILGWIFASVDIGAIIITLLTVSFQTIKAALANPVNNLRNE